MYFKVKTFILPFAGVNQLKTKIGSEILGIRFHNSNRSGYKIFVLEPNDKFDFEYTFFYLTQDSNPIRRKHYHYLGSDINDANKIWHVFKLESCCRTEDCKTLQQSNEINQTI